MAARRPVPGTANRDALAIQLKTDYQPPPPPPPPPPPDPPLPPPPPDPGAVDDDEIADVRELPNEEAKLAPVKPFHPLLPE